MSSSTFTPNLGIEQPATGSYANTWGNVANRSYAVIDAAIGGNAPITLTGTPGSAQTLITTPGVEPTQGIYPLLVWTGPQTAAGAVTIGPNTEQRLFIMRNETAATIAFSQGNGSSFTLQPNCDAQIYCDGTGPGANVGAAIANPQFANVLVTGVLTIQGSLTGNLNFGNASAATLGLGGPTSVPDPLTINGVGPGGQIRLVNGANYGAILRNDGNSFYVMATAANDPYGPWRTNPATGIALTVNLANGGVTANQGLTAPTIQSTGPLYAGTTVFTANLTAVSTIAIDTGQTNGGSIDLFFGGSTEGIGSARSGGVPQNQGGLTLFTAGAARLVVTNAGPVGIDMMPDGHWLCVNGPIHSASGGFVFPDGSVQTTAISGTLTQLTVTGNATIGGTLSVGNNTSVNGNINLTTGHTFQINGVPLSSGITGINLWYGGLNQAHEPGINIVGGFGITITFSDTSPGQFGTYTITNSIQSDARVKRNVQSLQGGLSIINQLHLIEGEYNGLAGTRDGERVVGVMADELQRVLPECVYSTPVKLHKDDVQLTDVLYVDTRELLFHMILAMQQLIQRLGVSEQLGLA